MVKWQSTMRHFMRGHNPRAVRSFLPEAALLVALALLGWQAPMVRAQALTPTPVATVSTFLPVQPLPPPSSIYLPVISGTVGATATPVRTAQQVYGILGTLEQGGDQLRTPAGSRYILVAATPALERRVAALAAAAEATVRVWGTLYTAGGPTPLPGSDPFAYIIVTSIVEAEATPVPARPPTATPAPLMAIARFDAVNLFTGPGNGYARAGQITAGMRCPVSGRNDAASWIRLECPGASGWIEPRFVNVVGRVAVAPVVSAAQPTPSPTATPTPIPSPTAKPYTFRGWRTLYFTNAQLRGAPAFVDDLAEIGANWGAGAPRAGMPADYFSIAWERRVDFDPGFYLFSAEADDGIRFLLDGVNLLDQWSNAGTQSFRLGVPLSGAHDLRVEYNEVAGAARLRFAWQAAQPMRWQAAYAGLPNVPTGAMGRMEPDSGAYRLDYNWGIGSPTGAPAANWTARWVGTFRFDDGNYIFQAQGQDGIRVTLDSTVVIDKWSDSYGEMRNRFIGVGGGDHTVTVDYYNRLGDASVRVWWYRDTTTGLPQ